MELKEIIEMIEEVGYFIKDSKYNYSYGESTVKISKVNNRYLLMVEARYCNKTIGMYSQFIEKIDYLNFTVLNDDSIGFHATDIDLYLY